MPWMKVDLVDGSTWVAIPGILYDHNNQVIDSVSDFAAYIDAIGLTEIQTFAWFNPCTQESESYARYPFPPYWQGTDFAIYPGQGIEIQASPACTLPLRFGQGYVRHLVCTADTTDYYCEWLGQEEFDKLEG